MTLEGLSPLFSNQSVKESFSLFSCNDPRSVLSHCDHVRKRKNSKCTFLLNKNKQAVILSDSHGRATAGDTVRHETLERAVLAAVHGRGWNARAWDDGGVAPRGELTRSCEVTPALVDPAVQGGAGGVDVGLLLRQSAPRVQRAPPEQQDVPHGAAEGLADEAVEEEVDGRVEHGQHVGQVVGQVDAPVSVDRGHVQVVDDHDGPGGPQHREDGGDGQQHGCGLPESPMRRRVRPELLPAALLPLSRPQRVDDQRVQHQEDAAGQEVDDGHMSPREDGVQRCGRVAAPPHVRPPEERQARRQR